MEIEPLTPEEAEHLLDLKQEWLSASPRQKRHFRRQIRHRLFRIRDGRMEFDKGLRKLFEAQFEPQHTWEKFTFDWDVGVEDPLVLVTPIDWVSSGGKMELLTVPDPHTGRPVQQRVCEPTAFTRQEM